MKTRVAQAVLGLVAAFAGQAFTQATPVKVDLCTLTERPEQFDGMVVEVRARFTDLKDREWAMDDVCLRPVLLVLRSDPKSLPEFDPSKGAIFLGPKGCGIKNTASTTR